jgi:tRNA U34 5-methylaminomethyl-2-thiouridine-forming methyltransferase MnmC
VELDELTRAFADRYVGLLYSVCDALKEDNLDPVQRRAAQMLLVDSASNVYDIASNADAFTRVLDLVVVMTLVSQEWDDDGRAVAVFGKRGQLLADALSQARVESRELAARVLTADQLDVLDSLLRDWRQENPNVVRASFVRFSNFAIGRGRSAAAQVLAARGLFAEVGEAGQAVDEARLLGERMFYRLKRESTLLRWQAVAIKDDVVATPELTTALADVHTVTDQIERLPANVAAEREAILTGLDDRLQRADATIADVRAALDEANTFVASLTQAGESLNEMLTTADTLLARHAALDRSKTGNEGHPFDIREYEQTAKEVTLAAERINELLTATEDLLGSPDWRHGMQEVTDSVDGRIMMVADQSQVVMNAFFWRVCALLGVLLAMLIFYRVISLLLMRNREKGQAAR